MVKLNILAFFLFIALGEALPKTELKREHTELLGKYDFVIAGGGTAGLTVADRLSEAFPDSMTHLSIHCN
jgi:choline dehydrogenase